MGINMLLQGECFMALVKEFRISEPDCGKQDCRDAFSVLLVCWERRSEERSNKKKNYNNNYQLYLLKKEWPLLISKLTSNAASSSNGYSSASDYQSCVQVSHYQGELRRVHSSLCLLAQLACPTQGFLAAKRALQTRLRLAGFKASHGWQDVSFEQIEPQLLRTLKQQQQKAAAGHGQSPPRPRRQMMNRTSQHSDQSPDLSYPGAHRPSQPVWTTPDHRLPPTFHPQSDTSLSFSRRTIPQITCGTFSAPSSAQPHSHIPPPPPPQPSHPHTPEQIIRSKWTMARIPSQTHSNTTPEDDELRDQTTAAEMMLFLATGSPSPDHHSLASVSQNSRPLHHPQLQPQFRT
ncbi:hypothetical protein VP01_1436g5 [Puccinia sorghi]|uniref:Uncharacterized protein n=1 Tax=Puccinia sorghi TaxID=27349 RepID=A0A0L6VKA2_9BASI|nr:hypothetical protein VP01_1436g5 [Puccinia sorghi]